MRTRNYPLFTFLAVPLVPFSSRVKHQPIDQANTPGRGHARPGYILNAAGRAGLIR